MIRPLVALCAAALFVSGCASADTDTESAPSTRTVTHELGEVTVPVDPERVVALDEYAGMSLLNLGITPSLVYGTFGSLVGAAVFEHAGVEVVPMATAGQAPDAETVATTEPGLIVATNAEGSVAANYDAYSGVAPTIVTPYDEPWRDVLRDNGRLFDREDRADATVAQLEATVAEISSKTASDPTTLSILADTYGMLFTPAPATTLSDIVAETGFERPDMQSNGSADGTYTSAAMLSPEVLASNDGDLLAVLQGTYYDAAAVEDLPTFQNLTAARDGRIVRPDGDMWFGSYGFAVAWLLEDLDRIADGRSDLGTVDDAVSRWDEFTASTT